MPAYMIVEARITDLPRFRAYAEANPPLVARFGGRYLAIRTATEPLEGDWEGAKVVISEWPDMDAARRYWHSPEYAAVKRLREGTGTFRVLLVDGLATETLA
ncbi:MAG: DUF1330 domain-containing protein [Xanthomonadaceae bacterium]|jgi:uncharacterized protein (DUF1330 family)|nr:DUF1330 domain-containing protein [Xanthomonadaceae bacterium]